MTPMAGVGNYLLSVVWKGLLYVLLRTKLSIAIDEIFTIIPLS